MEDFGYRKNNNPNISKIIKKLLLLSIVFASISCFILISIFAYNYFYKKNDDEIEIIKSPKNPIKVFAKHEPVKKSFDQFVYNDIFENGESLKEPAKIIRNPEPKKPPIINKSSDSSDFNSQQLQEQNYNDPKTSTHKNSPEKIIIFEQEKKNNQQVKNIFKTKTLPEIQKDNKDRIQKKRIRVQVAALTSTQSAEISWEKLNRLYPDLFFNLKHYVQKVDLENRGIFYRLQIGDFYNQIKAEEFCKKYIIKSGKTGADCIIVE